MMYRFVWAALVAGFTSIAPVHAADYTIDWQLRFPFRLFSDFSDVKPEKPFFTKEAAPKWLRDWGPRRDLYVSSACQSDANPITCSEMMLGATRVERMRNAVNPARDPQSNKELAEIMLTEGLRYDSEKRHHYLTKPGSALIIDPQRQSPPPHKVWLFVNNAEPKWTCRWRVDGNPEIEGPCRGTQSEIRRTQDISKTSRVVVSIKDRPALSVPAITGAETLVIENVIAGLGDSYGSGEGNPDIPARLPNTTHYKGWPQRPILSDNGTPDADSIRNAAYWVDRNCHRSLQSAEARAAIHFSAENPKREVAFVGVACSGAEIYEGVLGRYRGTLEDGDRAARLRAKKDPLDRELWRLEMSQLNQVRWSMCADEDVDQNWLATSKYREGFEKTFKFRHIACSKFKRPVDAVLLSVGGNDVGFARVIAWLLTRNRVDLAALNPAFATCLANPSAKDCTRGVIKSAAKGKCRFIGDTSRCIEEAMLPLAQKFATLGEGIKAQLDVKPDNVILSLYPDPNKNETGQNCGTAADPYISAGLERWPLKTAVRQKPLGTDANFPDTQNTVDRADLRAISNNFLGASLWPAVKQAAKSNGWHLADSHVQQFRRHGWCAGLPKGPRPPEDDRSLKSFQRKNSPAFSTFNAYAPVQRWMRTPNDSYMTQNSHPSAAQLENLGGGPLNLWAQTRVMEIYGIFHPNALGSAAMADAYLKQLRETLGTQKPAKVEIIAQ